MKIHSISILCPILTFLICSSCQKESSLPPVSIESRVSGTFSMDQVPESILFLYDYQAAGASLHQGFFIDRAGHLKTYRLQTGPGIQFPLAGRWLKADIDYLFSQASETAFEIPGQELEHYYREIAPCTLGSLTEPLSGEQEDGTIHYLAFQLERMDLSSGSCGQGSAGHPGEDYHEGILLKKEGPGQQENTREEAAAIVEWLQSWKGKL